MLKCLNPKSDGPWALACYIVHFLLRMRYVRYLVAISFKKTQKIMQYGGMQAYGIVRGGRWRLGEGG